MHDACPRKLNIYATSQAGACRLHDCMLGQVLHGRVLVLVQMIAIIYHPDHPQYMQVEYTLPFSSS